MAEIDKLTLEIEDKSSKSTDGIEELISSLEKLNNTSLNSTKGLLKLSNAFNSLQKSMSNLQNMNFNKLDNSINRLSNSFTKIDKATSNFDKTSNSIKTMSSSMNSLMRSMNKLSTGQSNIGEIDLSKLVSQNENLSKLGSTSQSLMQLKDGAKSINTLVKSLDNMNKLDFNKTYKSIEGLTKSLNLMKDSVKEFSESTQDIKLMASALNSLQKALDKLSSSQSASNLDLNKMNFQINKYSSNVLGGSRFSGATDFLSMNTIVNKVFTSLGKLIKSSNDYIETQNLFNVVMGESTSKAWEFIQALESIGVNQEEAMHFSSAFYDIGKSLGLTTKNAYTLSEQFTKLTYDYASLYNLPVQESFQKLQSAITGTTEPIRRLGKDISVAKLEEVALNLGIEESVRNMTQAEKAELRFIAVMQQSTSAMNDMERTINQPANALRILKAQLTSLGRELGNLFIPALTAVLPYLIAFTKLLRGIVSEIASFFGINFNEIDFSGINSQLGQSDAYTDNLANNLGDASNNAKKLKDYMIGIDELNVLNKDTGTIGKDTGASAGVGGLGVNLEDFGYDVVLESVKSKADEILKTFEKWKTPLLATAGILAGMWAVGKITKFVSALKGVQTTSTLLSGAQGIGGLTKAFFGLAGSGGILGKASTAFVTLGDKILLTFGYMTGSVTLAGLVGLGTVLGGVALAGWGIYNALQPSVKQMDEFKGVSEQTKTKLEPLIETWKNLDKTMMQINWKGVITDEDVTYIQDSAKSMSEAVLNELSVDRNQELKDLEMLSGLQSVTEEQYQELVNSTNEYYDSVTKETEDAQKEINSITEKYRGQNIKMTEEDSKRLKELYDIIGQNAVTAMSESEKEQMTILNRLKYNQKALTIQAGSETLQEAKKNYDNQIKEAKDWKARMLSNLDKQYNEMGNMTEDEYNSQKQTIKNAYDDMVKNAEDTFDNIQKEVKNSMGDQYKYIDEGTFKIKSVWKTHLEDMLQRGKKNLSDLGDATNTGLQGLKNKWDERLKEIKENSSRNLNEIKNIWNNTWSNLGTNYQNVTDGLGRWMDGIFTNMKNWFKKVGKEWDKFWDDPLGYVGGKMGSWLDQITGRSRMSVGIDMNTPQVSMNTPTVTAFARGGFVPNNASFISPNASLWTAGEAGREVVGNFRGKTTVMPLEDTGFVQAMYQAVYQASKDANESGQPIHITVQPQVKIGNKDIKQAQDDYEYDSGGSLIRRI